MEILLTGATGMVGSHLARALTQAGHRVRCLVRRPASSELLTDLPVEQLAGDVTDPVSVGAAVQGVEVVVHTAGVVSYWERRREELHRVNVEGTRLLLDAARAAGVRRLVLTSSMAAVGYVEGEGLGDEDTPFNWGGMGIHYCETKRAAEELVLGAEGIEGVALCPGIILGTQDIHFNGGRMLEQVAAGGPPGIPPGATTVSVIDDVVAGHLAAMAVGQPGRRYILGGHPMPFVELYATIARVMGKPRRRLVLSAGSMRRAAWAMEGLSALTGREPMLTRALAELSVRNRRYSSARAAAELGYTVSPLEPCIEATWRWYQDRGLM